MFENDYLINPNLLLISDNRKNMKNLENTISNMECNILKANSQDEALDILHKNRVALILIDLQKSGKKKFEVIDMILKVKSIKVPVIYITEMINEKKKNLKGLEDATIDFLFKPIEPIFLRNKIKMFLDFFWKKNQLKELLGIQEEISQKLLDASEELNHLNKELHKEITARKAIEAELKEKNKILDELSRFDPLTGLSNRRDIIEKLEYEVKKFERFKRKFCLLIADIDHFKKINDTYGHDCGDSILKSVANVLLNTMRKHDILSRWGGEEFLFFFPECKLNIAKKIAERLRTGIEAENFIYNKATINLTMSFGVSEFQDGESIHDCIKRADLFLYKAKSNGRNLVVFK